MVRGRWVVSNLITFLFVFGFVTGPVSGPWDKAIIVKKQSKQELIHVNPLLK